MVSLTGSVTALLMQAKRIPSTSRVPSYLAKAAVGKGLQNTLQVLLLYIHDAPRRRRRGGEEILPIRESRLRIEAGERPIR